MTEFIPWTEAEMQALLGIDRAYALEDLAIEIKTRSGSKVLRSTFDVGEKVAIVRSLYKRKLCTGDFGSPEDVRADMAASGYKERTEAESQKSRDAYNRK